MGLGFIMAVGCSDGGGGKKKCEGADCEPPRVGDACNVEGSLSGFPAQARSCEVLLHVDAAATVQRLDQLGAQQGFGCPPSGVRLSLRQSCAGRDRSTRHAAV